MEQEQEHTVTAGLRRWLATAGQDGGRMSHAELARQLDYSPEYVYRVMGESTPLTPSFRGRFQDVFGAAAASAAFEAQPEPAEMTDWEARPGCNCGHTVGDETHASDCPARAREMERAAEMAG